MRLEHAGTFRGTVGPKFPFLVGALGSDTPDEELF